MASKAINTHGPGIDDPLVMRYDGDDYFYHKNHLGSIMEITNIYQATVKTYDYDAFGRILGESGSLDHNAFTYTGREYHARSGLYYYRARFYDPQTGRFITPDPIGILGGVNLYAYVGNAPVDLVDPLGLQAQNGPWAITPGAAAGPIRAPNKIKVAGEIVTILDAFPVPHAGYQILMDGAAFGFSIYNLEDPKLASNPDDQIRKNFGIMLVNGFGTAGCISMAGGPYTFAGSAIDVAVMGFNWYMSGNHPLKETEYLLLYNKYHKCPPDSKR